MLVNKVCTVKNIQWKDIYNLDNSRIDHEHQTLFSIARKAQNVNAIKEEAEQKEYFKLVLRELYAYIRKHFDSEEAYMIEHNYPHTQKHQEKHQHLLDQINFIVVNLNILNDIPSAQSELYYFIQKLFVKHIKKEDSKITKYLKRNQTGN